MPRPSKRGGPKVDATLPEEKLRPSFLFVRSTINPEFSVHGREDAQPVPARRARSKSPTLHKSPGKKGSKDTISIHLPKRKEVACFIPEDAPLGVSLTLAHLLLVFPTRMTTHAGLTETAWVFGHVISRASRQCHICYQASTNMPQWSKAPLSPGAPLPGVKAPPGKVAAAQSAPQSPGADRLMPTVHKRAPRPDAQQPSWVVPKQAITARVRPGSANAALRRPRPGSSRGGCGGAEGGGGTEGGGGAEGGDRGDGPRGYSGGGGGGGARVHEATAPSAAWNLATGCEDWGLRLLDEDRAMWRTREPDHAASVGAAGQAAGQARGASAPTRSLHVSERRPALPGQVCYGTNNRRVNLPRRASTTAGGRSNRPSATDLMRLAAAGGANGGGEPPPLMVRPATAGATATFGVGAVATCPGTTGGAGGARPAVVSYARGAFGGWEHSTALGDDRTGHDARLRCVLFNMRHCSAKGGLCPRAAYACSPSNVRTCVVLPGTRRRLPRTTWPS